MRKRIITAKCGPDKVRVLIVEFIPKYITWWAIQGSHIAYRITGGPLPRLRSGCQLNNVNNDDVFTYYGDGTDIHPDNIADMDTFKRLLNNKF